MTCNDYCVYQEHFDKSIGVIVAIFAGMEDGHRWIYRLIVLPENLSATVSIVIDNHNKRK